MQRFLPLLALASAIWGQQDAPLVGLPEYGVTLTGSPAEPTLVNNSNKGLIGYVLRLEYASGRSDYRRNLQTRGLRLNVLALGLGRRSAEVDGDVNHVNVGRFFLDLLHGGVAIPPGGTVPLECPADPTVSVVGLPEVSTPNVSRVCQSTGLASTPPGTVRVVLDALIFADGQFVGPDEGHNFEVLANQLLAEQELAQRVSAARNDTTKRDAAWAEVTRLAQPYGERSLDPEYELSDTRQVQVARDLVFAKNRAGEDAVFDVADRELAIPKLWRAK